MHMAGHEEIHVNGQTWSQTALEIVVRCYLFSAHEGGVGALQEHQETFGNWRFRLR